VTILSGLMETDTWKRVIDSWRGVQMTGEKRRSYTPEFKYEAMRLITEEGLFCGETVQVIEGEP
jgi:hypothetical protein